MVDCRSRCFESEKMPSTTCSAVISRMKAIFARFGIPERVVSDNGPQFAAEEFSRFAHEWEFRHVTTSPHYPRANGLVERSVQTAKHLLKKAKTGSPGSLPRSLRIQEHSNRWISLSSPILNEQKTTCDSTNDQESAKIGT